LSERQFHRLYGTKEQCVEGLAKWRWPEGFGCPRCQHRRAYLSTARALYQCTQRRTQTSLTADAIFHSTTLALTTWFSALYHLTQAGSIHTVVVTGPGRQGAQNPTLRWVNTMLATIKNAMLGTDRQISLKRSPRYLVEFQYRFNRRFKLEDMIGRLAYPRCAPHPCRIDS